MSFRKTASGGQITGVERVERVHTVDHPEGVDVVFPESGFMEHTAAVRIDQENTLRSWTANDDIELEIEDRRD